MTDSKRKKRNFNRDGNSIIQKGEKNSYSTTQPDQKPGTESGEALPAPGSPNETFVFKPGN
jgi:hypothetical protein